MTAMIRNFLFLALVGAPIVRAFVPPSCDLQCSNAGYCAMMEGTADDLIKQAESGKLIQTCVCKPGYTGVACGNVVQQCSLPERKCHNGAPCEQDQEENWMCNCELADSISLYAGQMCRTPITEYCTGRFKPNSPFYFCTNGGRCLADFISAQMAPGDTSANQNYQKSGCACAPEFYGPHCEFLKINKLNKVEEPSPSAESVTKDRPSIVVILLSLFGSALLVTAAFVYRRRSREREEEFSPPVTHIINLSPIRHDDEEDSFHSHPMLDYDNENSYYDDPEMEEISFDNDSMLRNDVGRMT